MKKWVLVLTMPSGGRWVLAERGGCLALFPVSNTEPTPLREVFGFDTEAEAREWMRKTSDMSEQGAELLGRVEPLLAEALQ